MMRSRPELEGKLLIENTWDWRIVDALTPEPGDLVIRKTRYNGFHRTGLEDCLRAAGIRHLLRVVHGRTIRCAERRLANPQRPLNGIG